MITHKNTHLFDSATDELEFWSNVFAEWARTHGANRDAVGYLPLSEHFANTQRYIDYYRDWKESAGE